MYDNRLDKVENRNKKKWKGNIKICVNKQKQIESATHTEGKMHQLLAKNKVDNMLQRSTGNESTIMSSDYAVEGEVRNDYHFLNPWTLSSKTYK